MLISIAQAATDAAAHQDETFFTSPYTWLTLALLVFLGLVWRAGAFRSVLSGLDARAEAIRGSLAEAEALRTEAQAMLAQVQRRNRDAIKEAEDIVAHARGEAERQRAEAEAELTRAIERRRAQAMDRIARAESDAIRQLRDTAVEVAMTASRKVLTDQLAREGDTALVEAAIDDVRTKLH